MRSYPFESGDLPSLSLRDASTTNGDAEVVCSDSAGVEMSEAMMLMPPAAVVASSSSSSMHDDNGNDDDDDDDNNNDADSTASSTKKSWDELAVVAGSVLVSPSSGSSVVSELSVMESPFMEVLDMLLAGKTKEEEHLFLREMVVDLMTEVDHLKEDLDNSKQGFGVVGNIISNKNLFSLLSGNKSKDSSSPEAAAKKTVNDMIKKREQPTSEEEATEMVIQQLTKKIEEQNVRNSDYVATIKKQDKQLELFKRACGARGAKIADLQKELEKVKACKKKEQQRKAELAQPQKVESSSTKENNKSNKQFGADAYLLPVRTIAPSPTNKQGDKIAAFSKILNKPFATK